MLRAGFMLMRAQKLFCRSCDIGDGFPNPQLPQGLNSSARLLLYRKATRIESRLCRKSEKMRSYVLPRLSIVWIIVTKFTFGRGVRDYFKGARNLERDSLVPRPFRFIGDYTMEIAQRSRFAASKSQGRRHDATILLGYSVFAIIFLVAMYFASMSSGVSPGDFATMTVFP